MQHLSSLKAIALTLLLTACSTVEEVSPPTGDTDSRSITGDATIAPADGFQGEDDRLTFDAGSDGAVYEFVPQEGGFLWPCSGSGDCLSSYCLETEKYGDVCTTYCEEECPLNWKCKSKTVGADIIFLCSPPETDLCEPCSKHEDCGTPDDLCLPIGTAGETYCTTACSEPDDCPPDYQCDRVDFESISRDLCRPTSGSCVCLGELDGSSQLCANDNPLGKCYGERICQGPDGWTECSAAVPAQEVCDGLDNDCNDDKDDGLTPVLCEVTNEHGTCQAQELCAGTDGWLCPAQTPAAEICDGIDNDCDGGIDNNLADTDKPCDSPEDADDCMNGTFVCDAAKASMVCTGDQNIEEICNGLDDDCDGATDEEFVDSDGDGEADCVDPDDDGDGIPEDGDGSGVEGDNPCSPPELAESCDDNCPGVANSLQIDEDKDGIGDECDVDTDNDGVPDNEDCAPLDPTIHPGAPEVCNGKDDDCDGQTDPPGMEGCKMFFIDADSDSFGFDGLNQCVCGNEGTPPFTASAGGDCNDSNPEINPLAEELCNEMDDNCDGDVDNFGATGCTMRYLDEDQDDFGVPSDQACVCGAKGFYSASQAGDCDDGDPDIYPGADEYCNDKDDNCNFKTDEEGTLGCNEYYLDEDNDDYGLDDFMKCLCAPKGAYHAELSGECDDTDSEINPSKAELCLDGKDNNCNGSIDEANCSWQ